MWVKIIKASKENYWYADRVGTSFEPVGETVIPEGEAYIIDLAFLLDDKTNRRVILKSDCKIIVDRRETDDKKHFDWRMRINSKPTLREYNERSSLNTRKEIEYYEKLNKNMEVKSYNTKRSIDDLD